MRNASSRRWVQLAGQAGTLAAVIALALLVGLAVLPGMIGYHPVVVLSGSMVPTLNVGDVAVTRAAVPSQLEVGDVITYHSSSGLITHRIIDIEESPSGRLFHTQGDANATPDSEPTSEAAVVAKVAYRIPRIGFLMGLAETDAGMMMFIGGPVAILLLMWARDWDKRRARNRRAPSAVQTGEAEGD